MGLPYIDSNKPQDRAFVQTLKENLEVFIKKDIATAKLAHEAWLIIGHSSERYFK